MHVRERVATALACAALDRQLAGILIFDLDPDLLQPLTRWLCDLIGASPSVSVLGATTTDGDLWTRVRPELAGAAGFRLEHGPLVGVGRPPGLIVVPDLTRLGLAGARAAVTMIGADVVHLERTGLQVRWRPEDYWIACCRRDEVGRVSPHLLDRFAVRIDAAGLGVRRETDPDAAPVLDPPDPRWVTAVRTGRLASLSKAAAEDVVERLPLGAAGMRRELALARIARALAALDDDTVVEHEHVDAAARLIGLTPPAATDAPAASPVEPLVRGVDEPGDGEVQQEVRRIEVPEGDSVPLRAGPLPDAEERRYPYPEDHADLEHDPDPLRFGARRRTGGPPRGHPVGTRPARELRDIAVTASLLESARFQAVRCGRQHFRLGHPLHVEAADLRSHLRAPRPAHLLVLVLDHTCHRDWDWYDALTPYLRWAYAARASVGVVEVGAADAPDELCARGFSARGLLDPRVAAALERRPGRATPLAHGLSLAARQLRHNTQHGDAPVTEAVLLVATDGRANIPLAASRSRRLPERVAAEGVQDALRVACQIGTLHRVHSVVVGPGSRPGAHLTTMLADALGGSVITDGAGEDG
ncbi:hypothetical protein OG417_34415 [Actinoallomurus sp. NBC_01490]|uniref:hypothetical protein n=1 Tax=Actinoallomurus sp. NBC_01490 TaxID=2903557 RepID=UPI002E3058D1|nr:hypothetical protein [Actinoallomurus sp. NBC_01490]